MTLDIAKQLGFKEAEGAVITSDPGSAAHSAGREAGMVITRAGKQDVHNAADFQAAANDVGNDGLLLLVKSTQGSRFVMVK